MYSLEQLKIFVAVCKEGSFSAAARKLKRAQSGVSQSISNLEISINQTLFDRSLNTPTLTIEGEALLPIAESILHQTLSFDQKVASFEQQHEHAIAIAIEESLLDSALLTSLSHLVHDYSNTNIEIIAASTFEVEEMVSSGTAQIGIIYADGKMQNTVDFFTLGYNRFVIVVAPSHPLATLKSIKDIELRSHRQVVLRSSMGREFWFSYAISTNKWYANNHQILLTLAQQGIGWAMVPEDLASDAINTGLLVSLDVEFEPNGWINTIDCITSRSHSSGPVFEAVLAQIKQHMHRATNKTLFQHE
jgi:DNA-binding transcriptional LysR family regulator